MNMLGLRDLVLIAPTHSSSDHHHSNLPLPSPSSLSVGLGIFPLLTASHPNDLQDSTPNNTNYYWNNNHVTESSKHVMMECDEESGGEFRVCLDCGNRAKKDCSFKRCRTCCKGRGFDCNTHLKSTWVPASLRRDRDITIAGGGDDGGSTEAKRPRASHSSSSNATTTKSFSLDTSSCHQDAGFKQSLPPQVQALAVFRCHRVSAIGNGEDEIAYLATVNIRGHVFKGFLYDHGVDGKSEIPCVSELQLGNNGSGKSNRECSSSAIGVPSTAYPASAC